MGNLSLQRVADDSGPLPWLDRAKAGPRLAMMVARAQARARPDGIARVFVRSRRFPFDAAGKPILPGLDPGFVTDLETGEVFAPGTPAPARAAAAYLYTTRVLLAGAAPRHGGPGCIPLGRLLAEQHVDWVREAQRLRTQLDWSTAEIGACDPRAAGRTRDVGGACAGEGAIIGVADYGVDFAHANFRDAEGRTRLLAIWDQNGAPAAPGGLPRGRAIERAEIDAALQAPGCPYAALGYHPHDNYYTDRKAADQEGAHGTHVLDIAAGNGAATGLPGVAPGAELVFVQLPAFDWKNPGDLAQGAWVYEAAAFIFERAARARKPAVVNLSLTTNTGTHDGTNPVELALAALLRAPGRAVVVCAGNERSKRIHAAGLAQPGAPQSLAWRQPAHDSIPNQLLLCHEGEEALALTLAAPAKEGAACSVALPEADGEYSLRWQDRTIGTVVTRGARPPGVAGAAPPLRQVAVTLLADMDGEADEWRLTLTAGAQPVAFHAWIERDDPDQSWFATSAAPGCTLGSLASCDEVIVVGAYDALAPLHRPPATFSSEGPTRDGRAKPDLIAPGVGILAARSLRGDPRQAGGRRRGRPEGTVGTGTSQAAPHVTGAVALLFAAAGNWALTMSGTFLRDLLRETARRDTLTPQAAGWDPHAGCGRLAVRAALDALPGRLDPPREAMAAPTVAKEAALAVAPGPAGAAGEAAAE
ncbi:S8 family serine peptidase [Siccirubricoccus sp. KC 17139]|uniref:S8 family serine peptidase n=1 Tax=Siccirubricoccus soli TaxID=2899147 RepID=A0ABT1CYC6_9PROT|nr:S8 family serine peptidase [Siccirubricoccus soli]MCO6414664.1 S8 family serine peptidase [Siccirubricoccus soli]MCP2680794.1 S8 family serine peptidase [Siccirubricoccus soli]